LIEGFPKATGSAIYKSVTIVDLDKEGTTEIIAGTEDGNLYVWDLKTKFNGSKLSWTSARQNIHNTGSLRSSYVPKDSDGDGFNDSVEKLMETDPLKLCSDAPSSGPSLTWPADLVMTGTSYNKLDILDLSSYIAPIRRLDANLTSPYYDGRWDMNLDGVIDLVDLSLLSSLTVNGQRAMNANLCLGLNAAPSPSPSPLGSPSASPETSPATSSASP